LKVKSKKKLILSLVVPLLLNNEKNLKINSLVVQKSENLCLYYRPVNFLAVD